MSRDLEIVINEEIEPVRIDKFIADAYPEFSRTQIKELIVGEKVRSNGDHVKPSTKVHQGDLIAIQIPDPVEYFIKAEPIPLEFIYQDSEIAVINKPAGMVVHPTGKMISGTMVNALLYHLKDLSGINGVLRPGIVHRLDKDTSGIIIVAKNDQSHRFVSDQFRYRTVLKIYKSLVWGGFDHTEGMIDKAISMSTKGLTKMISGTDGKESLTEYKVIEEFKFLSLIDVYPKTGRTHQIRTHFASIGHPVFGDSLYNGRRSRLSGLSTHDRATASKLLKELPRQALHAHQLTFTSPLTEEKVTFISEIPADMQNTIDSARSEASAN